MNDGAMMNRPRAIPDMESYALHLKAERNAFKQAMDFFGIGLPENSGDRNERIKNIVNTVGQTITDYGVRNVNAMVEALALLGADPAPQQDRAKILALNF
jgi:hypothetical protein